MRTADVVGVASGSRADNVSDFLHFCLQLSRAALLAAAGWAGAPIQSGVRPCWLSITVGPRLGIDPLLVPFQPCPLSDGASGCVDLPAGEEVVGDVEKSGGIR